ncbi:hypothetical protein [Streptomyces hygroscopicus]|uniref:hypothetical protein n=1 Tax=Streptomyces hygroscopicus TaxID=1912 RepID=UPI0036AC8ED2
MDLFCRVGRVHGLGEVAPAGERGDAALAARPDLVDGVVITDPDTHARPDGVDPFCRVGRIHGLG